MCDSRPSVAPTKHFLVFVLFFFPLFVSFFDRLPPPSPTGPNGNWNQRRIWGFPYHLQVFNPGPSGLVIRVGFRGGPVVLVWRSPTLRDLPR